MSKNSSPIPIQTKVLDNNNNFNITWQKWFQGLGNDWVEGNRVKTIDSSFHYTISGCIVFFSYTRNIKTNITLPYIVGVDSVINGVVISKGTKTIELESPCSGFYFITF